MPSRLENAARAAELRVHGLTLAEIGEAMADEQGREKPYSTATVHAWLNDPDGSRQKARKASYRGTCVDCGGKTDGSNGRATPAKRCRSCDRRHRHESRYWTPDRIIAAIQEFARRYGHPPTATEWNPPMARATGRDDWSERFHADGCWPGVDTAQREFGSWNAALEAAGFAPRGFGEQLYRTERAAA